MQSDVDQRLEQQQAKTNQIRQILLEKQRILLDKQQATQRILLDKQAQFEALHHQQWEEFSKAYDAQTRKQLAANLEAARIARNSIAKLEKHAEIDKNSISSLNSESKTYLMAIERNARASQVKNVVNRFSQFEAEFLALKSEWESTVEQMLRLSKTARDSARRSEESATSALDQARLASRASHDARQQADKVEEFNLRIGHVEDKSDEMNRGIDSLVATSEALRRRNHAMRRHMHGMTEEVQLLKKEVFRMLSQAKAARSAHE
ncbi:MAG: hypothetical protein R8K53_00415 [Mariprofundaceae bacterium]